jgi:hypothetical protein
VERQRRDDDESGNVHDLLLFAHMIARCGEESGENALIPAIQEYT